VPDIQNADPKRTVLNRVLLGVVIFLGLCIFAAFVAVVYGAISGWTKHSTPAVEAPDGVTLQKLPPGASIVDMKVDGGRTVVRLKTKTGEEIDIFDTATGKLVARIAPEGK
jgi:hypothetical protein